MTDYLTVDEVLKIHEVLIQRHGGVYGLRDRRLLEAAVSRPQTGYYPDLIAEAAALWESLTQNHAFVDGNKRVGFGAMLAFLTGNGMDITVDADAAWHFISGLLESGDFRFELLDAWLRDNTSVRYSLM